MDTKIMKRLLAVLLAAVMTLSFSALAYAEEETGTASLEKVTDKVAVILDKSDSSAETMDETAHSYTAVKIMDLYQVVEGEDEALDSDGKPVYQYKLVLTAALAADPSGFKTLLAGAGFGFDENTGEITMADGSAIASKAGENENESDAAALAALIAGYAVENNISGTAVTLGTSVQLESGYWVIYETGNTKDDGTVATKPILLDLRPTDANGDPVTQRNITLKDAAVTLSKDLVTSGGTAKEDTVAIGDTVDYQISTCFPVYEANAAATFTTAKFELKDTFSAGLSFVYEDEAADGVSVKIGGSDAVAYTDDSSPWDYKVSLSGQVLTISFNPATVLAKQGKSVLVSYAALVNDNALVNKAGGNANAVELSYSNNPEKASDVKKLTDETAVYSFAFALDKLDGATDTLLSGAEFKLYAEDPDAQGSSAEALYFTVSGGVYTLADKDADGATQTITTGAAALRFNGLDEGTYYLKETKAVDGYAKLANAVTVTITAKKDSGALTGAATVAVENATALTEEELAGGYGKDTEDASDDTGVTGAADVHVVVRNYKGISLPETGSVASILVMAAGALLVLGGGLFLLLGRRKKEED